MVDVKLAETDDGGMRPGAAIKNLARGSLAAAVILLAGTLTLAGRIVFGEKTVSAAGNGAESVFAADVDGDGDLDVLSASVRTIAWYENDGRLKNPSFAERVVANTPGEATSVYAADLDGDGDMDVLGTSWEGATWDTGQVLWYENDGSIPPSFAAHVITNNARGARSVVAADMDGDGDVDVLSAAETFDQIAWYENDGARPPSFTMHVLTEDPDGIGPLSGPATQAWSASAVDLDRDGDMDVLFAAPAAPLVGWFENDGGHPPAFTMRTIVTNPPLRVIVANPYSAAAADVDGDGDLDVFVTSTFAGQLLWLENDGASPPTFTPHVISEHGNDNRTCVYAADLDGDGDMDAVSTSLISDEVEWHENLGGSPVSFATHLISDRAYLASSVFVADIDGDGDLDVLSASQGDSMVAWYPNQKILPSSRGGK